MTLNRSAIALTRLLLVFSVSFSLIHAGPRDPVFPAQLIFPELYKVQEGRCSVAEMPIEADFTWTGDHPVELQLYLHNGQIGAGPNVDVLIKDDKGHRLEELYFMSIPNAPAGTIVIQPGERLRVPLAAWNGLVTIPKDGWYTVQASIQLIDSAKKYVVIRTNEKRVHFMLGSSPE